MDFNPRTPCGVRPRQGGGRGTRPRFQSTHPVWGATVRWLQEHVHGRHFNPRTPCGVRPLCLQVSRRSRNFNPRTPCGVRLAKGNEVLFVQVQFQSTHPVWGATMYCDATFAVWAFQSTHPVWGATSKCLTRAFFVIISIHAPRVGCDIRGFSCYNQSIISIHAPRVGCDRTARNHLRPSANFNPRTPCGVRRRKGRVHQGQL